MRMSREEKAARLKKAREGANFRSASEAARALGIPVPTYSAHENASRAFDDEDARRYARKFNVAPDWLLYGTLTTTPGGDGQPPDGHILSAVSVPEIEVKAGAGGGGGLDPIAFNVTEGSSVVSSDFVRDYWGIPQSYLVGELRIRDNRARILEVYGDSMYDPSNPGAPGSLFPGDRVLVDTGDTVPSPPGHFAVWDGLGVVVKQVDVVRAEPVRLRLSSRNPAYSPYEVGAEEARILGRVRVRISAV